MTAVAGGDLTQRITVDVKGEILELKNTTNTMVDQLSSFADEVTRVAREVGTEGKLGGQARVTGVGGTWKDLTDSVNSMAGNLTAQVRNIADVTTAVANGDLSKKITVDVKGEILELKNTINTMTKPATKDSLSDALTTLHEFVDRPVKRLLVVEDDEVARQSIVELIGAGDVETTTVGTGAEALAELQRQRFDCMLASRPAGGAGAVTPICSPTRRHR